MSEKVNLKRVSDMVTLLRSRGTLDDARPGDYAMEAPAGTKWAGLDAHEVVASEWHMAPGWRRRLLESLVDDTNAGTEPCTDAACEWCHDEEPTP